jgi:hypothetical protein
MTSLNGGAFEVALLGTHTVRWTRSFRPRSEILKVKSCLC